MKEINEITGKDIAHSLVKGELGAISVIGSLAEVVFGLLVIHIAPAYCIPWGKIFGI